MKKIYLTLFLLTCLFFNETFSQCSAPLTVPYQESFTSITNINQLPTCMAISNPSTCVTYTSGGRTGQNGAGFIDTLGGTSYFYSRGVQLIAGITYSASTWYRTSFNDFVPWNDFSILAGISQGTTGLVLIASGGGTVSSGIYTSVSGTFTVASSGVYYFAVRAISNGSGSPVLRWDDLDVIIPCSIASNCPSLTLVNTNTVLCPGQAGTITASGANTYTWGINNFSWGTGPTGPAGSIFTYTANQNDQYYVVGTSTLTGCSSTLQAYVPIYPAPFVVILGSKSVLCAGDNMILSAIGALSYSWSTEATSSAITVTPSSSAIYTVVGTTALGCTTSAQYSVVVIPSPVITTTASVATPTICKGETVNFKASGGVSYIWTTISSPAGFSASYSVMPDVTTTVAVVGTGANGCFTRVVYVLNVDECTGIKTNLLSGFKIFPNPGNGVYMLESGNTEVKVITLKDVTGKVIFSDQTTSEATPLNIEKFSNGIYFATVNCSGKTFTYKLIKQ